MRRVWQHILLLLTSRRVVGSIVVIAVATVVITEGAIGATGRQIGTAMQQDLGGFGSILLSCKAQRRGAAVGAGIDMGTGVQQQPDGTEGIAVGSVMQGRPTGGMRSGIRIGMVLQKQRHALVLVLECCPMQRRVSVSIGTRSQVGMGAVDAVARKV